MRLAMVAAVLSCSLSAIGAASLNAQTCVGAIFTEGAGPGWTEDSSISCHDKVWRPGGGGIARAFTLGRGSRKRRDTDSFLFERAPMRLTFAECNGGLFVFCVIVFNTRRHLWT